MDIEILETELNRLVADKEKLENNITRLEIELKKCMQQNDMLAGAISTCNYFMGQAKKDDEDVDEEAKE
tara:strand:+ start:4547 stop:4753 length:207 start_codon:yes stop_codon:yes gene_type:complete